MKHIVSRDNAQYKELRHLATNAQARNQARLTLLDGIHLCEVYVRQVGMPRLCIVSESARAHSEASALVMECDATGAHCVVIPDKLFGGIKQVEQGVQLMFLIDIPQTALTLPLRQSAVLLDQVQDPGNLGSILRTTAAAGVSVVACSTGCASAWAPRVMRAAMGAHFSLLISENIDLADLMRNSEVPIIATSSHAQGSLYSQALQAPLAWVFGNEGQGVGPELLALADHLVTIPQKSQIESLNVAASAAVCLFEQVRQGLI